MNVFSYCTYCFVKQNYIHAVLNELETRALFFFIFSKIIFPLRSSEKQWRWIYLKGDRANAERFLSAYKRTVSARWPRTDLEQRAQHCERWTDAERTVSAQWAKGKRTLNLESKTFQGMYVQVLKKGGW